MSRKDSNLRLELEVVVTPPASQALAVRPYNIEHGVRPHMFACLSRGHGLSHGLVVQLLVQLINQKDCHLLFRVIELDDSG